MLRDFLTFRRMLMPLIIQSLFWIGVILCVVSAGYTWLNGNPKLALQVFLLGPLLVRLVSELLIVVFRINDTLLDIYVELRKVDKERNHPD